MDWLIMLVGGISVAAFSYSGYLWRKIRSPDGKDMPNEFARNAIGQERWMSVGIFGAVAVLILVWCQGHLHAHY